MTDFVDKNRDISFYQTNLVCGAASDIGCGTRAKPILLSFMKHDAVLEASLTHAGTVVAVVWNEDIKNKHEIANSIFNEKNLSYIELTGDSRKDQLADYKSGKWYKGQEVDKLSIIEAGRIASPLTTWINRESGISEEDKQQLRLAFEDYIKESFLAIEDADVINQTSYWRQWEKDLTTIGKELIGASMPDVQIVSDSAGEECTTSKSCCRKKGTSSCCKKSE
jgi:hypothetical protein